MNDSSPPTVAELVDQYLKLGIENLAPDNQKLIRQVLREFKKDLGHLTADQLRPIDFLSCRIARAVMNRCLPLKPTVLVPAPSKN